MKQAHTLSLAIAAAIAMFGAPAWSADRPNHPAQAASASVANAMPGKDRSDATRMNSQTKAMNEMHDRMLASKTPQERDALAAEHMKLMQDSMALINSMSPGATEIQKGDMVGRHQTMEMRMELMRGTMQMLIDPLLAAPTK